MITIKQMEALFWVAQLGTFERAAAKLNTTQSAISKRMQELEQVAGIEIFDRSKRNARLTSAGEGLLAIAEEMLGLRERALQLGADGFTYGRRITVGVTELAALTWLPRFVKEFGKSFPNAHIEPRVGMSKILLDELHELVCDLVVVPDVGSVPDTRSIALQKVGNSWMGSPSLLGGVGKKVPVRAIADFTMLVQGRSSTYGLHIGKWLRNQGVVPRQMLSCDSLMALLGLTVAGVGLSYLPRSCFGGLVAEGKLVELVTEPPLPATPYAALYRSDRPSKFVSGVAELVQSVCNFNAQFQK